MWGVGCQGSSVGFWVPDFRVRVSDFDDFGLRISRVSGFELRGFWISNFRFRVSDFGGDLSGNADRGRDGLGDLRPRRLNLLKN